MKRILFLVFTIVVVLITGCSTQFDTDKGNEKRQDEKDNLPSDQVIVEGMIVEETKGDFVYRLETKVKEYSADTSVNIYAELEYIGEKDSITISHATSPFLFPITEKTRDIQIFYAMNQPLIKTVLKRGEPISAEYKGGSGGYSDQDPTEYVEFMKKIMEGKFPVGEYVVNGFVSFDVEPKTNNDVSESINIKAQVEFIVK